MTRKLLPLLTILAPLTSVALRAQGEGMPAPRMLEVRSEASSMENRIGTVVDPSLSFTDDRGYPFTLQQLFPGDKPVLLVPGYYTCPSMCGTVLEALVGALNDVELQPGKDYQLLNVTIDPRETPEVAATRKGTFAAKLNKVGIEEGWRFLVGEQAPIKALMDSVGFRYYWDEHNARFDHPPALIFLTPQGKVSRVIASSEFAPADLRLAIVEASEGKIGTFWDRVQLSCLVWDPKTTSYSVAAMTVMRIGGVITVLVLAVMIIAMIRRERRRTATPPATPATTG
ncbi:MAG: SCO family protein [Planctomycetes bacterium]|nr:SCO family protein [Planctomycetota bacterium]